MSEQTELKELDSYILEKLRVNFNFWSRKRILIFIRNIFIFDEIYYYFNYYSIAIAGMAMELSS